jgi:uncharacterized protein (TIGR00369 family)
MVSFEPQQPDFEAVVRASFASLTLMQTIGANLRSVTPGEVEIELPFREDLTQHTGILAAGILTTIVDVAGGYAAMTLMPADATVLTVEYKVNFVAPAEGERMIARARVTKAGRTLSVCTGDVFAERAGRETLVATMLATMMTISPARSDPLPDQRARTPNRHPTLGQHAADRTLRKRSWCVCGGTRAR